MYFLSMFRSIFIALLILLVLPVSIASASTTPPPPFVQETTAIAAKETAGKVLLLKLAFLEVANSLSCQLRGIEPLDYTVDCLGLGSGLRTQNDNSHYKTGGILVFASSAVTMLYTPPVNTGSYLAGLVDNFGITKQAHAQEDGQGFQSLTQIQNVFQLSRDITYLLMVIVFVIVGIAIMLRVHIDPRTVMTIQNQIPKAIIAILLITFSYAIVGLLIDMMWVGTYFGINAITSRQQDCDFDNSDPSQEELPLSGAATIGILNNPLAFTTDIFGDKTGCQGKFDGISGLSLTVGSTFADIVGRGILAVVQLDEAVECVWVLDGNFDFGNCVKAAFFEIIKILGSIVGFFFVLFALLIALLRVWVILLKAYIFLIIDIVFAPFWILISVLPGSTMTISQWLRNIVAQLAIFPTTAILLVLASVVAQDDAMNTVGANVFLPPLIGNPNIPDNLGALTAFGFILLTPEVANMVRDALKAPPSKYGQAVSQGAGRGNPMGAIGSVGAIGVSLSGAKNVPLVNKLPFLRDKSGPGVGGGGSHP